RARRKLRRLHAPPRDFRAHHTVHGGGRRMSVQPAPFVTPILPDNAPFSTEQRAWLNGFFAGLLSLDGAPMSLSAEQAAAFLPGAPAGDGDDGAAPWHDPAIPLNDRMDMAQDRPLRRRMMAAMAQQDCGQCGYNC